MRMLLWNLILALVWAALSDEFSVGALTVGFLVGYAVLFVARGTLGRSRYFRKTYLATSFIVFFLVELVQSALRIAHDILTPRHRMRPGVVAIPLEAKTDLEITFLANLISLTPGTLSLEISDDKSTLYIHAMYIAHKDINEFRSMVKNTMERRILELLR